MAEWAVEQLAEEVVVDRLAVAVEVVELVPEDSEVVAAAEPSAAAEPADL